MGEESQEFHDVAPYTMEIVTGVAERLDRLDSTISEHLREWTLERLPAVDRAFVERTLDDLGVPPLPGGDRVDAGVLGWLHSVARSHVDVAMEHRRKYGQIKLIANAPARQALAQALRRRVGRRPCARAARAWRP